MKTHLSTMLGFTLCAALGAIGACGSEALDEGTAAQADALSVSSPRNFAVRRDPQGGYLVKEAGGALETHVGALDDAYASAEAARVIAEEPTEGLVLYGALQSGEPSGARTLVVLELASRNMAPVPVQSRLKVSPGELNVAIPAPWRPGPPPEGADQP